jgi:hypothetical protein
MMDKWCTVVYRGVMVCAAETFGCKRNEIRDKRELESVKKTSVVSVDSDS